VEVLCADCCSGMFWWMEKKWCRTVLRSVLLSSDGEDDVLCIPFCSMVGGVGFHYGPVRQVSTVCEKIYIQ
jgi:hypothetical protein